LTLSSLDYISKMPINPTTVGLQPKVAIFLIGDGILLTSDRLLVDIAYATGFSSQPNFNRAFRKAVGTIPSAYRAQKLRD
jgi:hypothetical protein